MLRTLEIVRITLLAIYNIGWDIGSHIRIWAQYLSTLAFDVACERAWEVVHVELFNRSVCKEILIILFLIGYLVD